MHWIIFLKIRNSLVHSRKLILGHKIIGELNEYKKHIWTPAFLILKLIPVSILLGICSRLCCVQNVFSCIIIAGDRKDRIFSFSPPHFMIEEMKSLGIWVICPKLSQQSLPAGTGCRALTPAQCCFFWMAGCLGCPCLQDCPPRAWRCCSLPSPRLWMLHLQEVWAGLSEQNLRLVLWAQPQAHAVVDASISWLFPATCAAISLGTCMDTWSGFPLLGTLSREISDIVLSFYHCLEGPSESAFV